MIAYYRTSCYNHYAKRFKTELKKRFLKLKEIIIYHLLCYTILGKCNRKKHNNNIFEKY